MAVNLASPFYEEGDEVTCYCSAAVTGKQFVKISGARQAGGPTGGVTDATTGGNVTVAPAAAGDKVFGVAAYNAALGALVQVWRYNHIVPVTTGAVALTAGMEVQSDANGNAIVLAAGKAAGLCIDNAAIGADAQIALYP
jgi:hypothetical protein